MSSPPTRSLSLPWTVNCSILLTDLPLLERPAAAAAAGFGGVELWWPFPAVAPDPDEVDALVRALEEAGVRLTGLNLAAGDMPAGDRGLMSWPGREAEVRANLDAVTAIAERTGCRHFNALYGNRLDGAGGEGDDGSGRGGGVAAEAQDELAAANLHRAAQAVARVGGTVLVEPVSGVDAYPLRTAADAVAVLDRVAAEHGSTNLGLLLDVYHLAVNGDDVPAAISRYGERIAHVQVADAPGRGEPGTGELPIGDWLARVRETGYRGPVGLEYKAQGADPFGWLPVDQRGGHA